MDLIDLYELVPAAVGVDAWHAWFVQEDLFPDLGSVDSPESEQLAVADSPTAAQALAIVRSVFG